MEVYTLTPIFKKRDRKSYKGEFGRVLVVAGSKGFTGAAYLAARAALLTGSGLVTLGVPRALEAILETKTSAVMTRGLICTRNQALSEFCFDDIMAEIELFDAFAFGPGVGQGRSTRNLLSKLLPAVPLPMVIDADGLNLLADDLNQLLERKAPTVLTPHLGEFSRLVKRPVEEIRRNLEKMAGAFAHKYGVILLVKGYRTFVTDGVRGYRNKTGNPALATGGTGDVLTGIITSLLGQGREPMHAAAGGAWLHGMAADQAIAGGKGGLAADELLDFIQNAIKESKRNIR
ncbi:NAD(P)H-hydrate dehydratase [Planctomycetota bacterium]